jgi:hypothetical protein
MASVVDTNVLRSRIAQRTYVHDPADATVATKIAWVDLGAFERFMATVTVLAGAIVTFKIFASAAADGSNPVSVKEHATPTTADAAGDTLVLECSAAELPALGSGMRYVSAEVDMGTNSDTAAVVYTRANPRYATAGLTADVIS